MPVALVNVASFGYLHIALLTVRILQVPRPWDFPTRPMPMIKPSDDATSPSIPHDMVKTTPKSPIENSKSPEVLAGPHETAPLA